MHEHAQGEAWKKRLPRAAIMSWINRGPEPLGLGGSAKVYIERGQGQITAEGKFQVSFIVGRELMANGELESGAPSLLIRIGVNLDRKAAQVGDA